ncbi:MAG: alpha/beta hydrolase [Pseudomonadota bacterium]
MARVLNQTDLNDIFAVIPDAEARYAKEELQQRLSNTRIPHGSEVAWVDFSNDMTPLRAGVSDVGGISSRLIFRYSDSAQITEITSVVSASTRPGTIMISQQSECLLWFVPATLPSQSGASEMITKGLSVSEDVFAHLVSSLNEGAKLTPAETRVVYHIVGGLTLVESAERDGLSAETRRGQFKRACSKLEVSGQAEMIRLVLSQAVFLLFLVDEETNYFRLCEDLSRKHLDNGTRLEIRRLPNGRSIRVFESGPADGYPVVVVHGFFFLVLLQAFGKLLFDYKIRMILPLRAGYMVGNTHAISTYAQDALTLNLDDLEAFITGTLEKPVTLVGHSMGCATAVIFASRKPECVKQLLLMSPFLGRNFKAKSGLLQRMINVLSKLPYNSSIFNFIALQYGKSYRKKKNARSALLNIYGMCPADKSTILGAESVEPFDAWFGQVFADSSSGIAEDFRAVTRFSDMSLSRLSAPIRVLHGRDDPLADPGPLLSSLSQRTDCSAEFVESAGHFMPASHPAEVLRWLKDQCDA